MTTEAEEHTIGIAVKQGHCGSAVLFVYRTLTYHSPSCPWGPAPVPVRTLGSSSWYSRGGGRTDGGKGGGEGKEGKEGWRTK